MSTKEQTDNVNHVNRFRPSQAEIDRRYSNVRKAMEEHGLDALVVSGSEYTGFEGAVRYMTGFHILHRYAYVVITPSDDPVVVFPREATWVGDHSATFVERRELPEHCGQWIADYLKGQNARKVGIYGLEYIINVRDYTAIAAAGFEIVDFDIPFDYARAQKSDEEMASVRHSMEINKAGVLEVIRAYAPGKTEAELMGVAENVFAAAGCARNTMDMVQIGENGSLRPQMVFPTNRPLDDSDGIMYGLEVSGEGGHWIEYSRPLMPNGMDEITRDMMDAQQEFHAPGAREHEGGAHRRGSPQGVHAALRGPRLPLRPRLRPLHRHDHDRDAAHRRGLRLRPAREHGVLHAPARDERGAHPQPLLSRGVPGDRRGRRAAFRHRGRGLRRH